MMAIPFGGEAGNPDLPEYLPSESLPYAKIPGSLVSTPTRPRLTLRQSQN
jgi:hypothetical protein